MRRALVVGIDDYPFGQLGGCKADAEAVAALLCSHADGSPNFDCQVVTAPGQKITRPLLLEWIDRLFEGPAEVALLYFSGHGTENNLDGYLVTPDATKYDEGVAMNHILTLANRSRGVAEAVVVLDCCHSGKLGGVTAVDNDKATLRQGLSIITASRSSEPAVERAGRGLFTALFCDALDGGASDVLGTVTAASAYAYVDQALGPWEQRPLLKAHVSQLTPLRRNSPLVPPELLRELTTWFADPYGDLPLDPGYEPDALPKDLDKERVFSGLQRCRSANLVEPVGEEHMYYAAMNSRSCRLTALGRYYWHLAAAHRI